MSAENPTTAEVSDQLAAAHGVTDQTPGKAIGEPPTEFAKRWLQLQSNGSHRKSPLCPETYHERYAGLERRDWCCDEADLAAMVEARDATLADPADRDECVSCNGSGLYPNEVPGVGTEWLGCPDCDLAEVNHWKSRAERAEAERAEMRATVDRVRALADEWAPFRTHAWFQLRAALANQWRQEQP